MAEQIPAVRIEIEYTDEDGYTTLIRQTLPSVEHVPEAISACVEVLPRPSLVLSRTVWLVFSGQSKELTGELQAAADQLLAAAKRYEKAWLDYDDATSTSEDGD